MKSEKKTKKENSKTRLNLYISSQMLERLEFCADSYGVAKTQLAVMLIGQGLSGIEKAFKVVDELGIDFKENLKKQNNI